MGVARGRVELPDTAAMDQEEKEHYRFRELMIRNKDKRLYRSMMKNRKNRQREAKRLEGKRKFHDKVAKSSSKKSSSSLTSSGPEVKKMKTDESA